MGYKNMLVISCHHLLYQQQFLDYQLRVINLIKQIIKFIFQ